MPNLLFSLIPLTIALCIGGTLPPDTAPVQPSNTAEVAYSLESQSAVTSCDGLTQTQTEYVNEVLYLVNEARADANLPALTLDPALQKAAQVRASECTDNFSHTRPDGTSYQTAILQAGVVSGYTGESVAIGQTSAQQVVNRWLNSEMHRANILSSNYTRVGIGLAENSGNSFDGYAWVQLFAQ